MVGEWYNYAQLQGKFVFIYMPEIFKTSEIGPLEAAPVEGREGGKAEKKGFTLEQVEAIREKLKEKEVKDVWGKVKEIFMINENNEVVRKNGTNDEFEAFLESVEKGGKVDLDAFSVVFGEGEIEKMDSKQTSEAAVKIIAVILSTKEADALRSVPVATVKSEVVEAPKLVWYEGIDDDIFIAIVNPNRYPESERHYL